MLPLLWCRRLIKFFHCSASLDGHWTKPFFCLSLCFFATRTCRMDFVGIQHATFTWTHNFFFMYVYFNHPSVLPLARLCQSNSQMRISMETLSSFSIFKGRRPECVCTQVDCLRATKQDGALSDEKKKRKVNWELYWRCQASHCVKPATYSISGCGWRGPKQTREKSVWIATWPDSTARANITWALRLVWSPG